jgi:hypothetical protein
MNSKLIKLSYRKTIDSQSQKPWDQYVFQSTYEEFLMQSQLYNPGKRRTRFADMLRHVPNADKLHFLVGSVLPGYLQQLNGVVPDITDNDGQLFLPFNQYKFEIISSDITSSTHHQVAIHFFSDAMTWHETITDYLLLSDAADAGNQELSTHLLRVQPFLNIYSIQTVSA